MGELGGNLGEFRHEFITASTNSGKVDSLGCARIHDGRERSKRLVSGRGKGWILNRFTGEVELFVVYWWGSSTGGTSGRASSFKGVGGRIGRGINPFDTMIDRIGCVIFFIYVSSGM